MSTDARTITVEGYLGKDKQITKQEFSDTWFAHVKQANAISYTTDWMDKVEEFTLAVQLQCDIEFERLFKEQNK